MQGGGERCSCTEAGGERGSELVGGGVNWYSGGAKKGAAPEFADHGDEDDTAASRLALVVGRIVAAWPHADSEKLFCEKIDGGAAFGGVRAIGSGLRACYTAAELKGLRRERAGSPAGAYDDFGGDDFGGYDDELMEV